MKFKERYPELSVLFGTCFFVGGEEGLTDAEVLAGFRAYASATDLSRVRAEMSDLIAAASSDWQQAAHEAWRYFARPKEIQDWLAQINETLAV